MQLHEVLTQLSVEPGASLADAQDAWTKGCVEQKGLYGEVHPRDPAFDALRARSYEGILESLGIRRDDLVVELGCGPLNRAGQSRLSLALPNQNLLLSDCSRNVASAAQQLRRGFVTLDLNESASLAHLRDARAVIGLNVFSCQTERRLVAWAEQLRKQLPGGASVIALSDLHPFLDAAALDYIQKQPQQLHLPYLSIKENRVVTCAMLSIEADPELVALQDGGRLYNRYCRVAGASVAAAEPYLRLQEELLASGAQVSSLKQNARDSLNHALKTAGFEQQRDEEVKLVQNVKRESTGLHCHYHTPPGSELSSFSVHYEAPAAPSFMPRHSSSHVELHYGLWLTAAKAPS